MDTSAHSLPAVATDAFGGASTLELPKRSTAQAMKRGFRGRCPNCGEGRMFSRYLKVAPNCPVCGEDLSHQRSDDAAPYVTIVIVGHVIVTALLFFYTRWDLPTWAHLAIWLPLTLLMTMWLLQPVKGAVVGLQWAMYMHGFDPRHGADFGSHGLAEPDAAPTAERNIP